MAKYLAIAKTLINEFKAIKIEQIGRDLCSHVNAIVDLASVFKGETGQTIAVDLILTPSHETSQKFILINIELWPSWMEPIVNFIRHDKLSKDKKEAHKLLIKATQF